MFRRAALCPFALLAALVFLAAPARAQTEEILDTPAGWVYRYGASAATITADINAGLRPFSIQRVAANSYDVISVENAGSYAVSGFGTGNMHYNRTLAQMGTDLAGRRLVSLDCYDVSGQTQISAISIPNSGASAAGWGWLLGQTRQQIVDWVTDTTPALRITDLSIYTVGGVKYYAAVAVQNQGSQAQGWWWYFDKTEAEIATLLTQNSARLIDIELETAPTLFMPARFACVMVAQNPGAGWFNGSLTSQQVNDTVGQTGGRLTSLHRYTNALGTTTYAVSLVDNANAQTRRVRSYMAGEATVGTYGFKLKRVGGDVLASLNENFVFEPASSMKIVHAAYAIRQCALGNSDLEGDIWVPNRCTTTYYNNVCPDDSYGCDAAYEPLSTTIRGMMRNSHNGRTHTIELLYGRATLNSFADFTAALGNTQINHTLGCLCGETPNTTTAADLVSLYEQISDGSLFNSNWSETLFGLMANVTDWGYGPTDEDAFYTLGQVINQEAAGTSLTAAEIADFRDEVRYAVKGGAYGCDGTTWRCSAGRASLPHKFQLAGNWFTIGRDFAFTTFVNGGTDPGSEVTYPASEEILREQIREALESWDDACAPGITDHPDNLTVNEGQDATFTVVAGGTGAATYQWQRLYNGLWLTMYDSAGVFSGVTTATMTIHDVVPASEASFRCLITKDCGTSTTNGAALTVVPGYLSPVPTALPTHLVMHAPMPNPFNPQVTLRFELPHQTDFVALEVFDVAGRRVRTLSATSLAPGAHEFTWNGADDAGRRVSSGMYIARLRAGDEQASHRLMLVE
jgi:hypothetical protein